VVRAITILIARTLTGRLGKWQSGAF
jgi:hypothetical protein